MKPVHWNEVMDYEAKQGFAIAAGAYAYSEGYNTACLVDGMSGKGLGGFMRGKSVIF